MLLDRINTHRAKEHFKAFAGRLLAEIEMVSFADRSRENSEGKRLFGALF
jgi:hypothetical protein